jgi:hypothetical protein
MTGDSETITVRSAPARKSIHLAGCELRPDGGRDGRLTLRAIGSANGIEAVLPARGAAIRPRGVWDRWDVEVRGGLLGVVRPWLAVEEHGGDRQVVRIRSWPHVGRGAAALLGPVAAVAALTAASSCQ